MNATDDPRVEAAARAIAAHGGLHWDRTFSRPYFLAAARAALAAADTAAPARTLPDRETIARALADSQACGYCEGTCSQCLADADAVLAVLAEQSPVAETRAQALEEYDQILTRQGDLLTRTVNVLRGDPPPGTSWSHHDVPDLAAAAVRDLGDLLGQIKQAQQRLASGEYTTEDGLNIILGNANRIRAARAALPTAEDREDDLAESWPVRPMTLAEARAQALDDAADAYASEYGLGDFRWLRARAAWERGGRDA